MIDWQALSLSLQLATATALLLLPFAIWLARLLAWSAFRWQGALEAAILLPLVLPPTVLGFYLLVLLGPDGPLGRLLQASGLPSLPFTFAGLVVASVIYSMPFVVQPLQQAFEAIGEQPLEAAATLRAGPWDSFFAVVVPLAWPGFMTAAVLGFAHTVGEFGVVLMIGGNIPGETQVLSMIIYNHVEALDHDAAHRLAGGMLAFAFIALLLLNLFRPGRRR